MSCIDVTAEESNINVTQQSESINVTLNSENINASMEDATINATITEAEPINVTVSGANPIWGNITGTISNQTDLQDELNLKVSGPSTSNDNAIPTFDSTTGKLIKDSGLISEDNKIYQSNYPNSYIKFNNGTIEIWAGGHKQAAWN